MSDEWNSGLPLNEVVVEVEYAGGKIIEVMAYFGRDGSSPHWRSPDGSICWPVEAFNRWRKISKGTSDG